MSKILITGGTGSLGRALIETLHEDNQVRIFSRSETGQIPLRERYSDVEFILGDVKDKYALKQAVRGVDLVIHAAAFKFLDLAEKQAREATLTNVVGTLNLIEAIEEVGGVEKCIGISTDKVAYARNVYGCTKHIMEKLFMEANGTTKYTCVRYGNVLGTTGSVLTIWERQKAQNKPITITDKRMRRFFFSLEEAVALIKYAESNMQGGEVFAIRMPSQSLYDMAKAVAGKGGIIVETGLRPGEKMYETLIADYEGEEFTSEQSGNNEIVRIV